MRLIVLLKRGSARMQKEVAFLANHKGRLGQSGARLCELGLDLQEIVRDGQVTPCEMARLRQIAHALSREAVAVEDVEYDVELVRQILHIGRDRAPDRHLRTKIASLRQVREQYEAPVRVQPAEALRPKPATVRTRS